MRLKQIKISDIKIGPVRHEVLSPELNARVEGLRLRLLDVMPTTADSQKWGEGFRHDLNPEREIKVWEHIADAYEDFAKDKSLDKDAKKEACLVLVQYSTGVQIGEIKHSRLSSKLVKEVIDCYTKACID